MKRTPLVLGVVALVVLAAAILVGLTVARPTVSVTTSDGVVTECVGVGTAAACEGWASLVLADGPGVHVFDPADLVRVRLTTPAFGIGECRAAYYISREPDDPAAGEPIPCPTP